MAIFKENEDCLHPTSAYFAETRLRHWRKINPEDSCPLSDWTRDNKSFSFHDLMAEVLGTFAFYRVASGFS
jgi:hypothetical protein